MTLKPSYGRNLSADNTAYFCRGLNLIHNDFNNLIQQILQQFKVLQMERFAIYRVNTQEIKETLNLLSSSVYGYGRFLPKINPSLAV